MLVWMKREKNFWYRYQNQHKFVTINNRSRLTCRLIEILSCKRQSKSNYGLKKLGPNSLIALSIHNFSKTENFQSQWTHAAIGVFKARLAHWRPQVRGEWQGAELRRPAGAHSWPRSVTTLRIAAPFQGKFFVFSTGAFPDDHSWHTRGEMIELISFVVGYPGNKDSKPSFSRSHSVQLFQIRMFFVFRNWIFLEVSFFAFSENWLGRSNMRADANETIGQSESRWRNVHCRYDTGNVNYGGKRVRWESHKNMRGMMEDINSQIMSFSLLHY